MEQGGVQGCQDSDLQNFQQFAVKNHRNSLTRQTRQTRLIALLVNLSTILGYVRFVPTLFHEHIYIILHRSALPLCTHQTRGLHHAETPNTGTKGTRWSPLPVTCNWILGPWILSNNVAA